MLKQEFTSGVVTGTAGVDLRKGEPDSFDSVMSMKLIRTCICA
ncbi:hypothetical protein B4129_2634 [Bacillus safensis]|nr:hypothetical protein B4129_2634 [Bacillus safensis]